MTEPIDYRDLRPKGRSSDDRRVEPRREVERHLHYAEQILLSQACAYVDLLLDNGVDDGDPKLLDAVADLARAVVTFREAADRVRAPRVAEQPTKPPSGAGLVDRPLSWD